MLVRLFALLLGIVLLIGATGQVVLAAADTVVSAATLVIDDVPDVDTPGSAEPMAAAMPVCPAPISVQLLRVSVDGRMHTDMILRPPRFSSSR